MPDVSAAIVVLAGAVFTVAGVMPSPLTDASRQRLVGTGQILAALGVVGWLIGTIATYARY